VPGRDFDFVLHSRVVREHGVAAGAVAEKSDDAGMSASEHPDNAALGTLGFAGAVEATELHLNAIAVHGVFDGIAGDEDIAIEARDGRVRDDESVAIVMEDEAALDFVAGRRRRLRSHGLRSIRVRRAASGELFAWAMATGTSAVAAASELIAAAGEFLDGAALLEGIEHFVEGMAIGAAHVEASGDFVGRRGVAPKLKETQDVIRA